jgi:hypothetical protein
MKTLVQLFDEMLLTSSASRTAEYVKIWLNEVRSTIQAYNISREAFDRTAGAYHYNINYQDLINE